MDVNRRRLDIARRRGTVSGLPRRRRGRPDVPRRRTSDFGACFPGAATVQLENGSKKNISDLAFGDQLSTFSPTGDIHHESFLMDFHGHNEIPYTYLRVKHTGGVVEISPDHLLLAHVPVQFMRAAVLRPGDHLFLASAAGILVLQNITSIEQFVGKGAYAPLTFSGQLLVNSAAVSSYALLWHGDILQEMENYPAMQQMIIYSHHIMQSVAAPLRWGFSLAL